MAVTIIAVAEKEKERHHICRNAACPGRALSAGNSSFPILTGIGATLLVAHSHDLANVKEVLLIEVTHMPIALLGITAAWFRWIELRLRPPEGGIAGWVWPLC